MRTVCSGEVLLQQKMNKYIGKKGEKGRRLLFWQGFVLQFSFLCLQLPLGTRFSDLLYCALLLMLPKFAFW